MRLFFLYCAFIFPFILMPSCAVLDIPNRVAGYSIDKFENEKNGRYEQTFEMSKEDCFNASLEILKELKARVTHKSYKKGFIIAFDFSKSFDYCLDSTEAGVFINETSNSALTVSVICNNSMLAKNFSDKFFSMLNSKKTGTENVKN